MSSASESSAPEALLNVEAFTLTEAAMALKESYGECLLGYVDDDSKRVTMENFMLVKYRREFDTFEYTCGFINDVK